jgi:thioesterase-3
VVAFRRWLESDYKLQSAIAAARGRRCRPGRQQTVRPGAKRAAQQTALLSPNLDHRWFSTHTTAVSQVHEYSVLIVERHLDTFGHVNNATYLDLFEAARWDWITANGFGLDKIREVQQGPTLLEVNLQFKRELNNRQHISIRTTTESYEGKTCVVVQQMLDEAGNVCCIGRFVCGLFDLRSRRLVLPTPEWLLALGR